LLWHLALLGLNLGLIAGLYLRGLGQEYLAGWQSTWLDAAQVQALADRLLAPAAWITGLAVPDVTPLRHAAGALPRAPAATWLHLLAATVALVAVPRALLVLAAGWRCASLARGLPWPAVHAAHDLRLRLVDAQGRLAGGPLATEGECLCSPEGDRLLLTRVSQADAPEAADAPTADLWMRGLRRLGALDAPPSWDLSLDAARLPASAPGWPAQRRQLRALDALWPPAKRAAWQRLLTAWEEPLQEREQQAKALLADALLDMLRMRVPLPAQSEPLATLRLALRRRVGTLSDALHALYGGTDAPRPPLVLTGALPHRVERPLPTARNSVLGGMASGAAAGLGADAASAGLTLGAGAALGAVAGGLMAAGATDWLNRRQDRREARVEPDPDSAAPLLAAALLACWQRELGLGACPTACCCPRPWTALGAPRCAARIRHPHCSSTSPRSARCCCAKPIKSLCRGALQPPETLPSLSCAHVRRLPLRRRSHPHRPLCRRALQRAHRRARRRAAACVDAAPPGP
jgi:hypothetical protein